MFLSHKSKLRECIYALWAAGDFCKAVTRVFGVLRGKCGQINHACNNMQKITCFRCEFVSCRAGVVTKSFDLLLKNTTFK